MFNDIGKKIKNTAITFFALGIGLAVILGFMSMEMFDIPVGFIIVLLLFVAEIFSLVLYPVYGFGELIDKVSDIEKTIRNIQNQPNTNYIKPGTNGQQVQYTKKLDSEWICQGCGKKNHVSAAVCTECLKPNPNAKNVKTNSSGSGWICKGCGKRNDTGSMYCTECGKYR